MKKVYTAIVVALVALALGATAAFAAVNYTPEGGGFAGKGDVQTALGYNNAQMQANASSLSFTYEDQANLSQRCQREAGQSQVVYQTRTRVFPISYTIAYESRKNSQGQVTGFILDPVDTSNGGGLPTDICPANPDNPNDPWTPAGPVVVDSTTGGVLKVNGVALTLS